jgi:NADP-dependent 3-hydroxy acid dehydrogenase YdfG
MKKRFNKKIAVVSGAATGIGKAIACRLGNEGAAIALFDVNKKLLQATVLELKKMELIRKDTLLI